MKNKKILLATAAIAVAGAIGVGATALADSASSSSDGPSGLVQKIADTFHLNKSDVQKVFNDYHSQHQADRRQKLSDYLDTKIKDGTITQDQKTQILAKLDELHSQLENASPQDRRVNHQKIHDELQQWAKDNGINLDELLPHWGHHTDREISDADGPTPNDAAH